MSNNKPMPPVDNLLSVRGKRGKSFPLPKASWDMRGSPGRSPYAPALGQRVLSEALGSWDGINDTKTTRDD